MSERHETNMISILMGLDEQASFVTPVSRRQVLDATSGMVSELEAIGGLGYEAGAANGVVESQDPADGPQLGDICQDNHERCPMWAAQGECEANPKYMRGCVAMYFPYL